MQQFGELIKSLAGKAGVNEDDETLKKILSYSDVMQVELPDEFSKPLEQNLLTEDSARANQNVRGSLFAEYSGSVEDSLDRMVLRDIEFDDQFKGEYKAIEKNTREKIKRLGDGVKKLIGDYKEKANKPSGNSKEDHEKFELKLKTLNAEIDNLHRAADQREQLHKTEIDNLNTSALNKRKDYALRNYLSSKPLLQIGKTPREIAVLTAANRVKQKMAEQNLDYYLDEFDNVVLKQRKDGTDIDYFVDNKKIGFTQFTDRVLSDDGMLQINNDQAKSQTNGSGTPLVAASPQPGVPMNMQIAEESRLKLESLMGAQV